MGTKAYYIRWTIDSIPGKHWEIRAQYHEDRGQYYVEYKPGQLLWLRIGWADDLSDATVKAQNKYNTINKGYF